MRIDSPSSPTIMVTKSGKTTNHRRGRSLLEIRKEVEKFGNPFVSKIDVKLNDES